jgi:hypothetical protein
MSVAGRHACGPPADATFAVCCPVGLRGAGCPVQATLAVEVSAVVPGADGQFIRYGIDNARFR